MPPPKRRHLPQALDDPGKDREDVVGVVFGVPRPQGEPERPVGVLGRETAGGEDVRGFK